MKFSSLRNKLKVVWEINFSGSFWTDVDWMGTKYGLECEMTLAVYGSNTTDAFSSSIFLWFSESCDV